MSPESIKRALFTSLFGFCVLVTVPLRAQVAGATLSGAVTDAQGGVVPGAKVSVRNLGTGIAVETTTNAAGAYAVPNLNPADYEVSISAPGFSTAVSKVTLAVGAKQELNIPLTVGQITQTVEVAAVAPQIELTSSTISDEVTATTVRELPLNGRDWASLATLQPGVMGVRTQRDFTQVGAGGRGLGAQLSISGGRPTQNSYRLDGAIVNDYSNSGPGSVLGANLGVDAIQEFTVLTSNYSAEYGFTSGGVINAVTRSGTNAFHGSAFEFLRNDKLDARNFFSNARGLAKDELKQNQFGASGGWKLLKDRLFLFGAYEGVRRVRGLPITNTISISDAVRSGSVVNLTTGAIVKVASIDPNIRKYLGLYSHPAAGSAGCIALPPTQFSAPGAAGGCNPNIGLAPFLGKQTASENFLTSRGDYKLSRKDSLFATYVRDNSLVDTPLPYNNEFQTLTSYRQAIIAEETHLFNSTWVNSFRVAEDRTVNLGGRTPKVINPLAGDPSLGMQPGYFSAGITITGSGTTALPAGKYGGASDQEFWGQIFQVYDDAFATKGNHGLKFGFSYMPYQLNLYHPLIFWDGTGTFTFQGLEPVAGGSTTVATAAEGPCYMGSGPVTNGNNYDQSCGSLVNFLTDQPRAASTTFDAQAIYKHYMRDKVFGGYVQDDWRFRPNLTLNLGLRYEMSTIPTHLDGLPAILPSPFLPIPCGPPTAGFCPQPGIAASVAGPDPTSVLRVAFYSRNPTLRNFEPRIGFAWDPFRNGKTAIRGGFGLFDVLPLPYILALFNGQSAPYTSTLATLGSAVLPSPPSIAGCANTQPLCAANTQSEWPYVVPSLTTAHVVNPIGRTFNYIDNQIKRNYVYQYNLNIQRQITATTTIVLGYAGTRGFHHPLEDDDMNVVLPTITASGVAYWPTPWTGSLSQFPAAARTINPTTGLMKGTFWESSSWYNALQVKVDKRMSRGFQVQGSFTWSKSIDDISGSLAPNSFSLDLPSEPWYNLSWVKGLSSFDLRHNLVINGLWNAPTPKSLGAVGDRVLGGWQFGIITSVADGVPFWVTMGSDLLGEAPPNGTTSTNPPALVPGCSAKTLVNSNYRDSLFYINASCLSLVPTTADNAAVCDSTLRGFSAALAASTCANIRGNLGRNTITGPGLFNLDYSVFKNNYFRSISEMFNVQFRAEFFNLLNHTNFQPPPVGNLNVFDNKGIPVTTFGQLTATQHDNREIQFALKLVW